MKCIDPRCLVCEGKGKVVVLCPGCFDLHQDVTKDFMRKLEELVAREHVRREEWQT